MSILSTLRKQKNPDVNLLFLDCEWANNKNKSICQIALLKKRNNEIEELNYFINPDDGFDENCVLVNHITENKVKNCPTFDDIWKDIKELFTDSIIVGHNVSNADLDAIAKNLQRYNIKVPKMKFLDTYQISRNLITACEIKDYKLPTLCSYFDIELKKHHNALNDAYACLDLYDALKANYKFNIKKYIIDYDYKHFNYTPYIYNANLNREISSFLGTLKAIGMDNIINNQEMRYIVDWRNRYDKYSYITGLQKIIHVIDSIVEDKIITMNELKSLEKAVSDYINELCTSQETLASQELQGIVNGIEADNEINKEEVLALQKWLYENTYLNGHFPYDVLYNKVEDILADNIITSEEINELRKVFVEIKNPISVLNQTVIKFENNSFCLSGNFSYGSKKDVEDLINSKGGTIDKSVKKSTNYLVIGNNGSQKYTNGSYGTKFKKAKDYNIPILKEDQIVD